MWGEYGKPSEKFMSGFCGNGQHEGTSPKSPSGTPMKVCVEYLMCKCPCHARIDKMFEMGGMEREPRQNPEYVPVKPTMWMPDAAFYAELAKEREKEAIAKQTRNSEDETFSVTITKPTTATPTGRSHRGELEAYVLEVCTEYSIRPADGFCSTQFVSDEIVRIQGVKAPSTGAIHAVFQRWTKYGFAYILSGPVRFIGFTPDGSKLGLAVMRDRFKRGVTS